MASIGVTDVEDKRRGEKILGSGRGRNADRITAGNVADLSAAFELAGNRVRAGHGRIEYRVVVDITGERAAGVDNAVFAVGDVVGGVGPVVAAAAGAGLGHVAVGVERGHGAVRPEGGARCNAAKLHFHFGFLELFVGAHGFVPEALAFGIGGVFSAEAVVRKDGAFHVDLATIDERVGRQTTVLRAGAVGAAFVHVFHAVAAESAVHGTGAFRTAFAGVLHAVAARHVAARGAHVAAARARAAARAARAAAAVAGAEGFSIQAGLNAHHAAWTGAEVGLAGCARAARAGSTSRAAGGGGIAAGGSGNCHAGE